MEHCGSWKGDVCPLLVCGKKSRYCIYNSSSFCTAIPLLFILFDPILCFIATCCCQFCCRIPWLSESLFQLISPSLHRMPWREKGKTGCITNHCHIQQRLRIRPGALLYYKGQWSTLSELICQLHTCAEALSPHQQSNKQDPLIKMKAGFNQVIFFSAFMLLQLYADCKPAERHVNRQRRKLAGGVCWSGLF